MHNSAVLGGNFELQAIMQSLHCSPLSSGQLAKLREAGFETVDDLRNVTVAELSNGKFMAGSVSMVVNK